jgi:CHASE2 domain-containing sensor protein
MNIFISYRRQDAGPSARLLRDRLCREFGEEHIFFDVAAIAPGEDFVRAIDTKVASCEVLLPVIGKTWLTCVDETGARRIDAPKDYVRHEIASALRQNVRTIPVLVDNARMPREEDLPAEIAPLAKLNAHELRDTRYDDDVGLLIEQLKPSRSKSLWDKLRTIELKRASAAGAIAIAFLMFLLAWVSLFDALTLDTKIASYTMWLGERMAPVAISPDITMVAINEDTERALNKKFDRSWRREHARLLHNLATAEAKVVAFDLEFKDASEFDAELIAAMKHAQGKGTAVVLGRARPNPETTEIERTASRVGIMCIGKRLSYAALAPLAIKHDGRTTGSLAVHATYHDLEIRDLDAGTRQMVFDGPDNQLHYLRFPVLDTIDAPQSGCAAIQQGDSVAQLMIKLSPLEKLRELRHRYEDLVSAVPTAAETFRGKIVLVGLQKKGEDQMRVRGDETRFGIELHTDAVNNLLNGINVSPLGELAQLVVMAGMSAGGAWLRVSGGGLGAKWRAVLLGVVIAAYFLVTVYVYQAFDVLLNPVYDLTAFALAYFLASRLLRKWSP